MWVDRYAHSSFAYPRIRKEEAAAVEVNVEGVPSSASVLSNESAAVMFVNSLSYVWRLLREFDMGVNVSGISVHRVTGGQIAFNEFVGIATQGFTVLAGSRSTLVSIDDGVPRSKQIPERTGTMDVKKVGELLIVSLTRLVRVTPLGCTGETDTSMSTRT